uniref:Cysteine synthase, chloroplastic/chromoplastic n=2 Tax=Anthurium amnicola TaxID=1678845 RepID=A0A1D1YEQ2_9ARAE
MQRRSGVAALISSSEREDGRECIASNITELIGWTPLLELKQITKKDGVDVRLVGKLESYQPLSSVKDRGALRMIEDAEEKGFITPGITTLVEPTSGNLGISLACIAAQKGYKFIAVMPNHFSLERRILLKYLGADIKLTDSKLGFQGQLEKLDQLKANIPNVYVLDQFSNPANPAAHFSSTGPEIWEDTEGKIDIFVCGSGSGGTLSGAGSYLRMKKPSLKIICVEPSDSPVISGGKPGPHNIQGLGPGFIPLNLDFSLIDEVITISTEEAMTNARRLALEEGILVGISSGAALAACLKIASRAENKGKMLVTVFPSGGERYLSTDLFSTVREECMNLSF